MVAEMVKHGMFLKKEFCCWDVSSVAGVEGRQQHVLDTELDTMHAGILRP